MTQPNPQQYQDSPPQQPQNFQPQQNQQYYQGQVPPQQVNVNVMTPPAATGKSVSKVAYVLLAFFLGGLGIHNFYAGRTGLGILYLVFCWTFIPAIAGFIQAIIALCKPSDANGNIVIP